MSQRVVCAAGAARQLGGIIEELGSTRILVVSGRASYVNSGAEKALAESLEHCDVTRFSNFDENPKLEAAIRGIESFRQCRPDLVVGVGGGTAMDMAKLINLFATQDHDPHEYIEGRKALGPSAVPMVAVPTTAGSGSQATHFAVVYVDHIKYSVAHATMLPQFALVDPDLLRSLPRNVAASAGLDALNQGIESYWSVHATQSSLGSARAAIQDVWRNLARFVNEPDDASRLAMARAAHLAGQAIDTTKTTAPHAISYPITTHFGVPHGHAVGLVLPSILLYNAGVGESDCLHPAGPLAARERLNELSALMGASNPAEAARGYVDLMAAIGLTREPSTLGIATAADVDLIVREGFNPQRVNNNPRRLTEQALRAMLEAWVVR